MKNYYVSELNVRYYLDVGIVVNNLLTPVRLRYCIDPTIVPILCIVFQTCRKSFLNLSIYLALMQYIVKIRVLLKIIN